MQFNRTKSGLGYFVSMPMYDFKKQRLKLIYDWNQKGTKERTCGRVEKRPFHSNQANVLLAFSELGRLSIETALQQRDANEGKGGKNNRGETCVENLKAAITKKNKKKRGV